MMTRLMSVTGVQTCALPISPVDIIIGRETIKKHKLFKKIPSQLSIDGLNHDDLEVGEGTNRCACHG